MLFFLLMNVKVATIIGILTYKQEAGKILCSAEMSMEKKHITSGPDHFQELCNNSTRPFTSFAQI